MKAYDGFTGSFDLVTAMERFKDNPTEQGKRQFFKELEAAVSTGCQGHRAVYAAGRKLRADEGRPCTGKGGKRKVSTDLYMQIGEFPAPLSKVFLVKYVDFMKSV